MSQEESQIGTTKHTKITKNLSVRRQADRHSMFPLPTCFVCRVSFDHDACRSAPTSALDDGLRFVLLTVDFLLCREDDQLAFHRRWGGCDKNMGDRKMNRRMKIFFAPIFLSPIFLSPVILSPGFNQWVAGEARAGYFVVKTCDFACDVILFLFASFATFCSNLSRCLLFSKR